MTENEAIKIINDKYETFFALSTTNDFDMAMATSIKALEEIQQCREYKEIFESHFSEEALKLLSNKEEFGKWLERGRWIAKKCDEINRELEQYRAIGTVEEFKALKEKNVAKKPIDKIMYLECPTCGDVGILDCDYCSVCGQKLDWQ